MKIVLALFLVLFPIFSINSNEINGNESSFELSVASQNYLYHPHQYERSFSTSYLVSSINGPLQGNKDIANPIKIGYNQDWLRLEASYFKVNFSSINHLNATNFSSGIWIQQIPLNIDSRSEMELNLLYEFYPKGNFKFSIGGGARRIKTSYESSSLLSSYIRDNFDSYGPQLGFRINYDFVWKVGGFLDYNLLYTRGHRNYDSSYSYNSVTGPVYSIKSQAHGTIGEFKGHDIKGGLSFKLSDTANLRVGYNLKDLKFRYQNYYINSYNYTEMVNSNISSQLSGVESWKKDRMSGSFVELRVLF